MAKKRVKKTKAQKRAQARDRRAERAVAQSFVMHTAKQDDSRQARHAPIRVTDAGTKRAHTCAPHAVSFGKGLTISIGTFEFARLYVWLEQEYHAQADRELIYGQCQSIATEFLARQEAAFAGTIRGNTPYVTPVGSRITIEMHLGLTLRDIGKAGTNKVDVGARDEMQADESITEAMDRIMAWLEQCFAAERNVVMGDRGL